MPVRMISAALAATAIALFVGHPGQAAQGRPATQSGGYFGVNISALVRGLPRESWGGHLDAIAASGVDVVRTDAIWNVAEPQPPSNGRHRYFWSTHDALVTELARRGLEWIPIVDYSASWAASRPGDLRSPPRDIQAYADYAGALAVRYGRGGSFWAEHSELPVVPVTRYEIWNAPNYPATAFPADSYAHAYVAARNAIHGADPDAEAWVGGLSGDASEFLRAMAEARPDVLGVIDAVALHPYAREPSGVFERVDAARRTMDELGLADVPIAITEVGWATQGSSSVPHASDSERATYFRQVTETLTRSDCGVNALVPHTWVTEERDPANSEHWFGIRHPDGTASATSHAYAGAIRRLEASGFPGRAAEVGLCERRPRVALRVVTRPGSSVRASVSASGQRGRGVRAGRTMCHEARVSLGATPLAGAAVRFAYADSRGRRRRYRRLTTDARGVARYCFRVRRSARRGSLRLSVTRSDLARPKRISRRALLP